MYGWEDIENYGQSKQQWLEEFLELPNGIPSDDTFRRVFERIDPNDLENGQEHLGTRIGPNTMKLKLSQSMANVSEVLTVRRSLRYASAIKD